MVLWPYHKSPTKSTNTFFSIQTRSTFVTNFCTLVQHNYHSFPRVLQVVTSENSTSTAPWINTLSMLTWPFSNRHHTWHFISRAFAQKHHTSHSKRLAFPTRHHTSQLYSIDFPFMLDECYLNVTCHMWCYVNKTQRNTTCDLVPVLDTNLFKYLCKAHSVNPTHSENHKHSNIQR